MVKKEKFKATKFSKKEYLDWIKTHQEPHFEILSCGHQNNLLVPGRTTGVCPKGDLDVEIIETVYKTWE